MFIIISDKLFGSRDGSGILQKAVPYRQQANQRKAASDIPKMHPEVDWDSSGLMDLASCKCFSVCFNICFVHNVERP